MTREHVKELLPILTAYAEGKTIQYRGGEDCAFETLTGDPKFTETPSDYRIKPEPQTVLMTIEDFPEGMIWLKSEPGRQQIIISISENGDVETNSWFKSIEKYHNEGVLWSTDRKNWKPLTKIVSE